MKPKLDDYKIMYMEQIYFVLTPYDLFGRGCMRISGGGNITYKDAEEKRNIICNLDIQEYERLKRLGRSFPDND